MSLYSLRCIVSDILFNLFGYLAPALNSVKAVCSNDLDGIKEYLTYWAVLSVFGCLGILVSSLRLIQNYPPEAKVICVLWLTLPRFQGAYRIYALFLKWSYKQYEDDIDDHVSALSGKFMETVWAKLKMVLLVLFLSNNSSIADFVGGSNNEGLLSFASALMPSQWDSDTKPIKPPRKLSPTKPSPLKKPSMQRIQAHLLQEFRDLLKAGVYIKGYTQRSDIELQVPASLSICQLVYIAEVICLRSTEVNEEGGKNDVLIETKLCNVRSVEHNSDPIYPANSVTIQLDGDTASLSAPSVIYLQAEDADEADMIVRGLRLMTK